MHRRPVRLLRRVWARLRATGWVDRPASESDVARDEQVANSRAHGGPPHRSGSVRDAGTTTGTTQNELFVGRAAGDDLGYAEETGAEARAAGRPSVSNADDVTSDPADGDDATASERVHGAVRGVFVAQGLLVGGLGVAGVIVAVVSGEPGQVLGFQLNALHSAILLAAAALGTLATARRRTMRLWIALQALGFLAVYVTGTSSSAGPNQDTMLGLNAADNFLHLGLVLVAVLAAALQLALSAASDRKLAPPAYTSTEHGPKTREDDGRGSAS
ncbi:MAG: DUF4383 domain-containing protein [Pseudonocardiaceae bacterium]|nr:DUF4383 domain-containing protein [Pseudonocardiaceae bacterium]